MPRNTIPFLVAVVVAFCIALLSSRLKLNDTERLLLMIAVAPYVGLWGLWFAFLRGPGSRQAR